MDSILGTGMSCDDSRSRSDAEDAASRIERMHRPLIEEGHVVLRHFLATEAGILKNPRMEDPPTDDLGIPDPHWAKAKSWYAIVNALKVEYPVHVNPGDTISMVAVIGPRG